jgi:hypothetical protein
MAQSATYSSLSGSAPAPSAPSSSRSRVSNSSQSSLPSHGSRQSMAGSYSSASSAAGSSSASSYGRAVSPTTQDGFNGQMQSTVLRQPGPDRSRRKRPTFLTLQTDDSQDTVIDGRYLYTKRDKDQMRKSSPTVGESFRFTPGVPPTDEESRRYLASLPRFDDDYAMPRQEMGVMEALEVIIEPDEEDEEEPQSYDDELDRSINELTEENHKTPSPPAEHQHTDQNDDGNHLERQASSSNVRSQVHGLPESARLRKQASGSLRSPSRPESRSGSTQSPPVTSNKAQNMQWPHAQRQSPTNQNQTIQGQTNPANMPSHTQMLPSTGPPPTGLPPPPPQAMKRSPSAEQLVGRNDPLPAPPRSQSLEAQARRRAANDMANHPNRANASDPLPLPLRIRRPPVVHRSPSDATRSPGLRLPMPSTAEEEDERSPAQLSPPVHSPPLSTISSPSDSWPLTEENMHPDHYDDRYQHYQEHAHSSAHSRTVSSANSQRLSSLEPTPRTSRNSSVNGTPRTGRSRSNTLKTIASDANGEQADDTSSIAPSVMSAQWHRTPRERLGLGSRISHSEPLPWELGANEPSAEDAPPVPPKTPPRNRKGPLFSVFPARAPGNPRDAVPNLNNIEPPPRSPLLTEKFLVNVKDIMPDTQVVHKGGSGEGNNGGLQRRPSTSMGFRGREEDARNSSRDGSRDGASTPDSPDSKKKKKPKKESWLPSLGEIVTEYKTMGSKWYTYTEEDERDGQMRPSTPSAANALSRGNTTTVTAGKQPSDDGAAPAPTIARSATMQSATTNRTNMTMATNTSSAPSAASAGTVTNKERSNSTSGTNTNSSSTNSKPASRRSEDTTSSSSSSRQSREAQASKKKKKPKKSSIFPSLGEMMKEYREMTMTYYTAPYTSERPRDTATPSTGRS